MILHIGGDEFVSTENILMILTERCIRDHSEHLIFLRNFISSEQKMNPGGDFKTVILTEEAGERKIYYSPISAATLRKRMDREKKELL